MAKKKKYYAVAVGRATGIFTQWFGDGGAEKLVRGYAGAVYKGFPTIEEARAFIKANQGRSKKPPRAVKKVSSARTKARTTSKEPVAVKAGQIVIYTDGGALRNPGPGGYGAVIVNNGKTKELSKGFRRTTNNRMELLACIAGLGAIKKTAPLSCTATPSMWSTASPKGGPKNGEPMDGSNPTRNRPSIQTCGINC